MRLVRIFQRLVVRLRDEAAHRCQVAEVDPLFGSRVAKRKDLFHGKGLVLSGKDVGRSSAENI